MNLHLQFHIINVIKMKGDAIALLIADEKCLLVFLIQGLED